MNERGALSAFERGLAEAERDFLEEIGCLDAFSPTAIRSRADVEQAFDDMLAYEELPLRVVLAQAEALGALGLLERVLVQAWALHPEPGTLLPPSQWRSLLARLDRQKLRAEGSPFPETRRGLITLYRGIAWPPETRPRRQGLAWSTERGVARRFAESYPDPSGGEGSRLPIPESLYAAVFVARVRPSSLFWFSSERCEAEAIAWVRRPKVLEWVQRPGLHNAVMTYGMPWV